MSSNRSDLIIGIEEFLNALPQPLAVAHRKYTERDGWTYVHWDVDLDLSSGGKALRIETCTTNPLVREFDVEVQLRRGGQGAPVEVRQFALWYSPSAGGWYTLKQCLQSTLQEWFGRELEAFRVQL